MFVSLQSSSFTFWVSSFALSHLCSSLSFIVFRLYYSYLQQMHFVILPFALSPNLFFNVRQLLFIYVFVVYDLIYFTFGHFLLEFVLPFFVFVFYVCIKLCLFVCILLYQHFPFYLYYFTYFIQLILHFDIIKLCLFVCILVVSSFPLYLYYFPYFISFQTQPVSKSA